MSAQIIAAIRARATALDTEAAALRDIGVSEAEQEGTGYSRNYDVLRLIAAEFRALADTAEQLPGTSWASTL